VNVILIFHNIYVSASSNRRVVGMQPAWRTSRACCILAVLQAFSNRWATDALFATQCSHFFAPFDFDCCNATRMKICFAFDFADFNRVAFQIEEVYQPEWTDRNSEQFKLLTKGITQDVVNMYTNAYRNDDGRFMANVLAIE
jgi:hypothetical protein